MSGSTRFPTESPVTRFKSKVDQGSEGKNRIYHGSEGKIGCTMDLQYIQVLSNIMPMLSENSPKIRQNFTQSFHNMSPTISKISQQFRGEELIKSNFQVELSARRLSLQAASRREKLFFLGEDVARVDGVYEMFMEHISRCIKLVGAYDGLCLLHVFWTV